MTISALLRILILVFLIHPAAQAIGGGTFVYLSLDSLHRIAVYKADPVDGALTFVASVDAHGEPGSLAVDQANTRLYAAIRSTNSVSSFRINPATGDLTMMGDVTVGWNPAYVGVDASGKFLFTAHFSSARAAVYGIRPDGAVQAGALQVITTPVNPHSIQTDRSNTLVFVPCRGGEAVLQYRFNGSTGSLTANSPDRRSTPDSTGPRLLAFHPHLSVVYAVNEFGRSVTAYSIDTVTGTLAPLQTLSLQPRTPKELVIAPNIGGADIHTTPDGRFLYATNRGPNTIAAYKLDPSTGLMTAIGEYATERIPRSFAIDPGGLFLYAGGQLSGTVAAYRIDTSSGLLTPLRIYHVGRNPAWITVVRMNTEDR
jgi:6-phosphogluconolactonase